MLDLHDAGEQVIWSVGTDADTARAVLAEYDSFVKKRPADVSGVHTALAEQAHESLEATALEGGAPSRPAIGIKSISYVAAKPKPKRHSLRRTCIISITEYRKLKASSTSDASRVMPQAEPEPQAVPKAINTLDDSDCSIADESDMSC